VVKKYNCEIISLHVCSLMMDLYKAQKYNSRCTTSPALLVVAQVFRLLSCFNFCSGLPHPCRLGAHSNCNSLCHNQGLAGFWFGRAVAGLLGLLKLVALRTTGWATCWDVMAMYGYLQYEFVLS
jgi:hypothetical protein